MLPIEELYSICLLNALSNHADDSPLQRILDDEFADRFDRIPAKQEMISYLIQLIEEEIELFRNKKEQRSAKRIDLPIVDYFHGRHVLGVLDVHTLMETDIQFPALAFDSENTRYIYMTSDPRGLFKEDSNEMLEVEIVTSTQFKHPPTELSAYFYSLQNLKKFTELVSRIRSPEAFHTSDLLQRSNPLQLIDHEIKLIAQRPTLPSPQANFSHSKLTPEQSKAVRTFLNLPLHNIMTLIGPPGTGKTTVISAMTQGLVLMGYKVVLISPSYVPLEHLAMKLKSVLGGNQHLLIHNADVSFSSEIRTMAYRNSRHLHKGEDAATLAHFKMPVSNHSILLATTYSLYYIVTVLAEQRSTHGGLDPLVFIIDEASKLSILDFLIILNFAKRTTMPFKICAVGDAAQLQPFFPTNTRRTINESIFDKLLELPTVTKCDLKQIHRFFDPLVSVISNTYYQGGLFASPRQNTDKTMLIRLQHDGLEQKDPISGSYTNMSEVKLILDHLKKNPLTQTAKSIAIITPYADQRKQFEVSTGNLEDSIKNKLSILTFDSCQGAEFEIVYISFTRNTEAHFAEDPHRMNVALTRSQKASYLVYNKNYQPLSKQLAYVMEKANDDVDAQCGQIFPTLGAS